MKFSSPARHSRNAELAILECIVHIGAIDAVEAVMRGKFATNVLGGEQGADHLLVFSINALVDVGIHRLIEGDITCEDVAQCCIEVFRYLEHFARIGIELERTDDHVIAAERLDQAMVHELFLRLEVLLLGDIEQEALNVAFAIVFDELHIAHHVNERAIAVTHAVLGRIAVAHIAQLMDLVDHAVAIFFDHRTSNRVEPIIHHLLFGGIP